MVSSSSDIVTPVPIAGLRTQAVEGGDDVIYTQLAWAHCDQERVAPWSDASNKGVALGEQPRGFWAAAAAEPGRIAVIDPAGERWAAGDIASQANRLVHALRARGLTEGDPVATLLPNRAEVLQTLMAVHQAGWNYVPLNSNLTAAELSYILGDAGAKALVADQCFAAAAAAAANEAGARAGSPFGGRDPGLHPPRHCPSGPARPDTRAPGGRTVHAVHLGHDRTPQGGSTAISPRSTPRPGSASSAGTSRATASSPVGTLCIW